MLKIKLSPCWLIDFSFSCSRQCTAMRIVTRQLLELWPSFSNHSEMYLQLARNFSQIKILLKLSSSSNLEFELTLTSQMTMADRTGWSRTYRCPLVGSTPSSRSCSGSSSVDGLFGPDAAAKRSHLLMPKPVEPSGLGWPIHRWIGSCRCPVFFGTEQCAHHPETSHRCLELWNPSILLGRSGLQDSVFHLQAQPVSWSFRWPAYGRGKERLIDVKQAD